MFPYFNKKLGALTDEEFNAKESITRCVDDTDGVKERIIKEEPAPLCELEMLSIIHGDIEDDCCCPEFRPPPVPASILQEIQKPQEELVEVTSCSKDARCCIGRKERKSVCMTTDVWLQDGDDAKQQESGHSTRYVPTNCDAKSGVDDPTVRSASSLLNKSDEPASSADADKKSGAEIPTHADGNLRKTNGAVMVKQAQSQKQSDAEMSKHSRARKENCAEMPAKVETDVSNGAESLVSANIVDRVGAEMSEYARPGEPEEIQVDTEEQRQREHHQAAPAAPTRALVSTAAAAAATANASTATSAPATATPAANTNMALDHLSLSPASPAHRHASFSLGAHAAHTHTHHRPRGPSNPPHPPMLSLTSSLADELSPVDRALADALVDDHGVMVDARHPSFPFEADTLSMAPLVFHNSPAADNIDVSVSSRPPSPTLSPMVVDMSSAAHTPHTTAVSTSTDSQLTFDLTCATSTGAQHLNSPSNSSISSMASVQSSHAGSIPSLSSSDVISTGSVSPLLNHPMSTCSLPPLSNSLPVSSDPMPPLSGTTPATSVGCALPLPKPRLRQPIFISATQVNPDAQPSKSGVRPTTDLGAMSDMSPRKRNMKVHPDLEPPLEKRAKLEGASTLAASAVKREGARGTTVKTLKSKEMQAQGQFKPALFKKEVKRGRDKAPKPEGDEGPASKKGTACKQCFKAKTKCDKERPCSRCIRLHRQEHCCDRPEKTERTRKACKPCHDSKAACDNQRPCSNCVKRKIVPDCVDRTDAKRQGRRPQKNAKDGGKGADALRSRPTPHQPMAIVVVNADSDVLMEDAERDPEGAAADEHRRQEQIEDREAIEELQKQPEKSRTPPPSFSPSAWVTRDASSNHARRDDRRSCQGVLHTTYPGFTGADFLTNATLGVSSDAAQTASPPSKLEELRRVYAREEPKFAPENSQNLGFLLAWLYGISIDTEMDCAEGESDHMANLEQLFGSSSKRLPLKFPKLSRRTEPCGALRTKGLRVDPAFDSQPLCMYYEIRFVHPASASKEPGVGAGANSDADADSVVEVRQRCSESLKSYLVESDHMMDTFARHIFSLFPSDMWAAQLHLMFHLCRGSLREYTTRVTLGPNVHCYQSVCMTTLEGRIESIVFSWLPVDPAGSSPPGVFATAANPSVPTGLLDPRSGLLLDGFPPQGALATANSQRQQQPPPPNGPPSHTNGSTGTGGRRRHPFYFLELFDVPFDPQTGGTAHIEKQLPYVFARKVALIKSLPPAWQKPLRQIVCRILAADEKIIESLPGQELVSLKQWMSESSPDVGTSSNWPASTFLEFFRSEIQPSKINSLPIPLCKGISNLTLLCTDESRRFESGASSASSSSPPPGSSAPPASGSHSAPPVANLAAMGGASSHQSGTQQRPQLLHGGLSAQPQQQPKRHHQPQQQQQPDLFASLLGGHAAPSASSISPQRAQPSVDAIAALVRSSRQASAAAAPRGGGGGLPRVMPTPSFQSSLNISNLASALLAPRQPTAATAAATAGGVLGVPQNASGTNLSIQKANSDLVRTLLQLSAPVAQNRQQQQQQAAPRQQANINSLLGSLFASPSCASPARMPNSASVGNALNALAGGMPALSQQLSTPNLHMSSVSGAPALPTLPVPHTHRQLSSHSQQQQQLQQHQQQQLHSMSLPPMIDSSHRGGGGGGLSLLGSMPQQPFQTSANRHGATLSSTGMHMSSPGMNMSSPGMNMSSPGINMSSPGMNMSLPSLTPGAAQAQQGLSHQAQQNHGHHLAGGASLPNMSLPSFTFPNAQHDPRFGHGRTL